MAEIGKRIKKRRIELNMTQEELARKLGYKSKTTIAKIENGTNDIVQSKVLDFSKALQTSIAYLMGWEEAKIENINTGVSVPVHSHEALVMKEMSKMNKRGKTKLLDTAKEMNCSPLYNDNYQEVLSAAHERTDIEVTEEMRKHDDDIMMDDSEWE